MNMQTKKVKPWGTQAEGKHSQGEVVIIDADQFDAEVHEEIKEPKKASAKKAAEGEQGGK
jgi:hypothetical protein